MSNQEHISLGEIVAAIRATADECGIPHTVDTTGALLITPPTGPAYRLRVEPVDQPVTNAVAVPHARDDNPGNGYNALTKYTALYADTSINAYVPFAFYAKEWTPWSELIRTAERHAPDPRTSEGRGVHLGHILPPFNSGREAYQAW
ncbi:hypothetical protein [Nocardia wallacei]|uniref:hypothetical protein n=1 Tax=Nocardia wallacei TaxID=480035 RepID=UPI002456AB8D|nr:hypothetical protein [Nocardia wallacei]